MGKIIEIQYNGALGYSVSISDVRKHFQIGVSDEDWLNTKMPNSNRNNRDLIFDNYNIPTKISFGLADEDGNNIKDSDAIRADMPCPVPIILYVDSDFISADVLISQSNVLANNFSVQTFREESDKASFVYSDNQFFKNILSQYLGDDNYQVGIKDEYATGRRAMTQPTVWLWSKSLNENGKFNENSLFNLTPFVENITLNQTQSGGNFNISLLAIEGVFDLKDGEPVGIWRPDKKKYVKFKQNGLDNFMFKSVLDKFGVRKSESYDDISYGQRYQNIKTNNKNIRDRKFEEHYSDFDYNRSEVLFKNIISENDIIFISFANYSSLNVEYIDDFFVNHRYLPNKDWQMIGLVDSNQVSIAYENTSETINVSGRDCTKLLIEDGSYFFAKSFANPENSQSAFSNIDLSNRGDDVNAMNNRIDPVKAKSVNRLVATGMIDILFNPEARNVHFIMNLLMSRLSNIEICHSDLFDYYGEDRTKFTIATFETSEDKSESEDNEYLD